MDKNFFEFIKLPISFEESFSLENFLKRYDSQLLKTYPGIINMKPTFMSNKIDFANIVKCRQDSNLSTFLKYVRAQHGRLPNLWGLALVLSQQANNLPHDEEIIALDDQRNLLGDELYATTEYHFIDGKFYINLNNKFYKNMILEEDNYLGSRLADIYGIIDIYAKRSQIIVL